ncbi:MAG: 5'/3'-nucleotidase SurE [Rhizobiaceae bacterium]|nr:5'/3'-nucleotidase SurE [Rhizobiaceae bacterium]
MRILISNDDGIDAPGLAVLERAAARISDDVWTIAPDGNRSGFGHKIGLRQSFLVKKVSEKRYSCSGTPVDCVISGLKWLFKDTQKPELVLSGINEGRNVAEDVSYSGTVAVAREAAYCGIPSISLSMPRDSSETTEAGITWLGDRLQGFWDCRKEWAQDGHWLNVNLPRVLPAPLRAARIGRDKVVASVVVHEESENHAWIEPLADRNYFATDGDENHLIDSGIASVTCINWFGQANVPHSSLFEPKA